MNSRIPASLAGAVMVLAAVTFVAGVGSPSSVFAADESKMSPEKAEKKRNELRKMRDDALQDFYATKPEIKDEIEKAAGYGVFDASQVNIILFVGGLGGGVLVEKGTNKETFVSMKRLGTGPGVGYKSFRQLMVFKDKSLFEQFRVLGADVGASADATMKVGDKVVGVETNVSFNPLLSVYQITDRGALLQANWGGVAYTPDSDLNQ